MKKKLMPIAVDISHQKILIVGGGEDAFKKLRALQQYNAEVEVLSIKVCENIKQSNVRFYEKAYHRKYLSRYFMLYSCTNNPELNERIVKDCKEEGVLVNIHDDPKLCQFVSPAILRHRNISVAVSSNGENVHESIRIRNLIRDKLELN